LGATNDEYVWVKDSDATITTVQGTEEIVTTLLQLILPNGATCIIHVQQKQNTELSKLSMTELSIMHTIYLN